MAMEQPLHPLSPYSSGSPDPLAAKSRSSVKVRWRTKKFPDGRAIRRDKISCLQINKKLKYTIINAHNFKQQLELWIRPFLGTNGCRACMCVRACVRVRMYGKSTFRLLIEKTLSVTKFCWKKPTKGVHVLQWMLHFSIFGTNQQKTSRYYEHCHLSGLILPRMLTRNRRFLHWACFSTCCNDYVDHPRNQLIVMHILWTWS